MPEMTAAGFDFDGEVTQGANLIEAARTAGVPQFVHTSVTGAGQHTEIPGWDESRWSAMHATLSAKTAIQDRVRTAGFRRWTLLKPGTFMENFLPSTAFLFPRGVEGGLDVRRGEIQQPPSIPLDFLAHVNVEGVFRA